MKYVWSMLDRRCIKFCLAGLFQIGLLTLFSPLSATDAMSQQKPEVTVYAAASLHNAFEDIGAAWRAKTNGRVKFSFAASSALAKQIENGAPADIFASADQQWMDYLAERKLIGESTRTSVVGNRLVLVAPADSALELKIVLGFDLLAALGDGRLATGDPAHVPAGRYAQQALTKLGVWEKVHSRLARAGDVRAALALVERGEAPVGIVYATDAAVTTKVKTVGVFPDDSHQPIDYPFAALANRETPEVKAFLAFLTGPEARAIYERHGFTCD